MKIQYLRYFIFLASACVLPLSANDHIERTESQKEKSTILREKYEYACNSISDINEHVSVLHDLSKQCDSVTEIGVRSIVSTWGILQGLAESPLENKRYLGIDLAPPSTHSLTVLKDLAENENISFDFWGVNDMTIQIDPCDMLFIDSLHTYCHLTYELETFSPQVRKFICMHDTSEPWAHREDREYYGDYSEYPAHFDRSKRGLWPAVEDFLATHPEWTLYQRRLNNHGFTILINSEYLSTLDALPL